MTWANGDKYEGKWVEDQRNGRGTLDFANGDRFTGEFKDGVRKDGPGLYVFANGDRYVTYT